METQSTCSDEQDAPPLEDDMMWTGTGFIRTTYYGLDDL